MRIALLSWGTRGDAQPQVVLASALREHGYEVRVAAPENLRPMIEASGVEYAPLRGNSQQVMESKDGRRWLSTGNVRAFMKALSKVQAEIGATLAESARAATEDADAIVGGTLMGDLSFAIAQKMGVPFVLAHTIPLEKTGAHPSAILTTARLPPLLNRLTYDLQRKLVWRAMGPTANLLRGSLGIQPQANTIVSGPHQHGGLVLQMWSEAVLPRSADMVPAVINTGYIRVTPGVRERLGEAKPPEALVAWLERGSPPVYLGFGSMPILDPLGMASQALAVAKRLDLRLVLSAGWADLSGVESLVGERMFFVRSVDHAWLLPRCAAAVHHGGAGTTAASLEAGVPTIVCSVFADQPFWGERVVRLGLGAHVPFAKLDQGTLEAALRTALGDDVKRRAAAMGARLRAEDGLAATVDAIRRHIGPPRAAGSTRSAAAEAAAPAHSSLPRRITAAIVK